MWVNINGNWIGRHSGGAWRSSWNPQTDEHKALMEAVSVKPPVAIQHAQNDFIYYLKGNNSDSRNTWAKLACIMPYCGGMTAAADALLWWNNPARSASLGGANPPTYTVGQGFTGTANGYIDTGFNPSVDGGALYTQNDCSQGWYFYNNRTTGADKGNGLNSAATNNPGIELFPKYADNNLYYQHQGAYATVAAGTSINNLYTAVRLNNSQQQIYFNRTGKGLQNSASTALANETVNDLCLKRLGGARSSFSDDTIALRFFASGLDATDVKVICDAFDTLLMSLASSDPILAYSADGDTIDTEKWTVTNPNTDTAAFLQGDAIVMRSLQTLTANTFANNIKSVATLQFGSFVSSLCDIEPPLGSASVRLWGLWASDTMRIEFYRDTTIKFRIVVSGTTKYSVDTEEMDFAIFKILVSATKAISLYKWSNDDWIQVGDTTSDSGIIGSFSIFMATRGADLVETSMRDIYLSYKNSSTLIPS